MNNIYRNQVALLIRIIPSVYKIKDFAIHGGTAINLFYCNLPRYSVDIDITYLPLKEREESLVEINRNLLILKQMIEKTIPNIRVTHKPNVWKLLCVKDGAIVKIEVNRTKRGVFEDVSDMQLCAKAQAEFGMGCVGRIVSFSQLYGGKIAAALSRQHPRDLFDCKYLNLNSFDKVKDGLIFALLGSDKPIIESLQSNFINQEDALQNQFEGMSNQPFTYLNYTETRENLIENVNKSLTLIDREFLLSFEQGNPNWSKCNLGDLSHFPAVKWKLQNTLKLQATNFDKFKLGVDKLRKFLFVSEN